MELRGILLFVVFIACHFSFGGAQIVSWATPNDITSHSGTSTASITVAEDASNGVMIYTFEATPTGQDTISKYELLTSGTPFSLSSAGVLTLTGSIDYENKKTYPIEVRASDNNDPANTGVATVTITVTDVNEHKPTFGKATYEVCVVSGADAGDEITIFSATDDDTDNSVTYSINSGDTNGDFTVTGTKLKVNTGKELDKSNTAQYTLIIHAEDDGNPKKTGSATYEIEVKASCNGATALTLTFLTLLLPLIMSLL